MEKQPLLPDEKNIDEVITVTIENLILHLENLPLEGQWSGPSIYKIPDDIKKVHPKAFMPQLVSFGPYHHGEVHLSPMEKQKLVAFHKFQSRCGRLSVGDIVECVSSMLKDLQRSYIELEDKWKKEPTKFLELMILDGCFMLHVLLEDKDLSSLINPDIVMRDMLLLENQLPMKLLDLLYSMTNPNRNEYRDEMQFRACCLD